MHNKEITDSITIFLAEITDAVEDCDWDEIVDLNFFPKILYKTYLSCFKMTRESFMERIAQQDTPLSNHAHSSLRQTTVRDKDLTPGSVGSTSYGLNAPDVKIGQISIKEYKEKFLIMSTEEKQQKIAADLLELLSACRLSKKDIENIAKTVYQITRHAKRTVR